MDELALKVLEAARKLAAGPLTLDAQAGFIELVEKWVKSQPEWLQESLIGRVSGEGVTVVKRKELPNVLRSDPDFLKAFISLLASVPVE